MSDPRQTARARELRKEQTPAEDALWQLLRNRRLLRLKFRRQVPIGPYIADFYCHRYSAMPPLELARVDPLFPTIGAAPPWDRRQGR